MADEARPKIICISENEEFSPVTDADYENLAIARRIARNACLSAITAQIVIEEKLRRGARDVSTQYIYDLASGDLTRR